MDRGSRIEPFHADRDPVDDRHSRDGLDVVGIREFVAVDAPERVRAAPRAALVPPAIGHADHARSDGIDDGDRYDNDDGSDSGDQSNLVAVARCARLRRCGAELGVVVAAICPGGTLTRMMHEHFVERRADGGLSSKRTGSPIQPPERVTDVVERLLHSSGPGDVWLVDARTPVRAVERPELWPGKDARLRGVCRLLPSAT